MAYSLYILEGPRPPHLHVRPPQISNCLKKLLSIYHTSAFEKRKIPIVARGRSHVVPKKAWKTLGALPSPSFKALCSLCAMLALPWRLPLLSNLDPCMKTRKFQQRINGFPALKIACTLLLNLFKMAIPVQLWSAVPPSRLSFQCCYGKGWSWWLVLVTWHAVRLPHSEKLKCFYLDAVRTHLENMEALAHLK